MLPPHPPVTVLGLIQGAFGRELAGHCVAGLFHIGIKVRLVGSQAEAVELDLINLSFNPPM